MPPEITAEIAAEIERLQKFLKDFRDIAASIEGCPSCRKIKNLLKDTATRLDYIGGFYIAAQIERAAQKMSFEPGEGLQISADLKRLRFPGSKREPETEDEQ